MGVANASPIHNSDAEKTGRRRQSKTATSPGKKIKYCKAPQAPRRFKSAFIFYSQKRHKEIRKVIEQTERKGDKTPEVAKLVSEEWHNLSTEERSTYEEMARRDKQRFEIEKSMYTGPWKIPVKSRTKKDPDAPKRPMSSFLSFSNAKRAQLKSEHPGMTNIEASKILAKMWKEASDEEKREYIEREAELKAPKRPMSSFLSFSNAKRAQLKSEHPGMTNIEASKILAKMWKEASDEEKREYIEREAELREIYKVEIAKWREQKKQDDDKRRKEREQLALDMIDSKAALGNDAGPQQKEVHECAEHSFLHNNAEAGKTGHEGETKTGERYNMIVNCHPGYPPAQLTNQQYVHGTVTTSGAPFPDSSGAWYPPHQWQSPPEYHHTHSTGISIGQDYHVTPIQSSSSPQSLDDSHAPYEQCYHLPQVQEHTAMRPQSYSTHPVEHQRYGWPQTSAYDSYSPSPYHSELSHNYCHPSYEGNYGFNVSSDCTRRTDENADHASGNGLMHFPEETKPWC
eukprot:CAMPEP_0183329062 /NCGR_PEP_ID=MMETSP0160_2-20130417/84599_1 /TAXON_ID=2839 ORGANISM="Odontella Sinensis, Strain Grunow 1884" /NCGR_SAMPLE_ID=MMETSP0160_2 /ASSEMBLY_ACC=CAM_ASM_000250 /LENGTH=513 /DNA_ID=CAMNT_0025497239 /DNA_START=75 /DNA_END=1617 /DNA_ORIENTATION=-